MRRAGIQNNQGSQGPPVSHKSIARSMSKMLNFVKKEDSQDTLENLELSLNHYAIKDLNYMAMGG